MKSTPSNRRSFLQKAALVTAGITVLSSTQSVANVFKSQSPIAGYNPYTANTTNLRTSFSSAEALKVNGTLLDKYTNLPISNAKIEIWHVSPGSSKVRHRAHFYTNANGNYSFITDMPNRSQEGSPRVNFKITSGDKVIYTQLLIGSCNAYIGHTHWEQQHKHNPAVLPRFKKKSGTSQISFVNVV